MEQRALGTTGLTVSALGIGLAELGFLLGERDVDAARAILSAALEVGITFLDTAGCYDASEELLGKAVADRRDEFVLASKTGHMTDGCEGDSWGYDCVLRSIERSLTRMRTDRIDLMQLHSCDLATLERGEAIRAVVDARNQGKVRFIGYSGDNEAAVRAAKSGLFDTIQTSFNLVDQGGRRELFAVVRERGMGLIAKRPIANGVWRRPADPDPYQNGYTSEYHRRQAVMAPTSGGLLPDEPADPIHASLGFVLAHQEVSTAIVGSRNPAHVRANAELISSKPLVSSRFVEAAHRLFDSVGADWTGQG